MEELLKKYELKIERDLYPQVMVLIESGYAIEGVVDTNNKNSTKMVFKDKKSTIQKVVEAIERFAKENNLDKNKVKDYLLRIIENRVNINDSFKEEFEEVKQIVSIEDDSEER